MMIKKDEIVKYIERVMNSGLGKKKSLEYILKYINNMDIYNEVEIKRKE